MKWNLDGISFTPYSCFAQYIHGVINMKHASLYLLNVIFANNNAFERKDLWDSIKFFSETVDKPWILMEDFNCVLQSSKKSRGNDIPISRLSNFRSCIEGSSLTELSNSGLFYTKSNLQPEKSHKM